RKGFVVAARVHPRAIAVLGALTLLPVVLWLTASPLGEHFSSLGDSLEGAGMILGIAGAAAFGLNLILGARLRIAQWLCGGLDSMYRAHRALGRIVLIALVIHVALLVGSHATESASEVLSVFRPTEDPTAFIGLVAFLGLVLGVVLTLRVRVTHEIFLWIQRALGFVFVVGAIHLFKTDDVQEAPALRIYFIILAVTAGAAFVYRSIFGAFMVKRHECRVITLTELRHGVIEITLSPIPGFEFTPGQFIFVNFASPTFTKQFNVLKISSDEIHLRPGNMRNQFHPFSLVSPPEANYLSILVKPLGDYTRRLRDLEVGATARVEGPYGQFSYRNVRGKRQVWIAGGIGITPFLSMARSLTPDDELDIDLYYGVRAETEAHFVGELRAIAQRIPGFNVTLVSEDSRGHVTAELIGETTADLADREILICGPPGMIDALRDQLRARGIGARRIHFERFAFGPPERAEARPSEAQEAVVPPPPAHKKRDLVRAGAIAALTLVAIGVAAFLIVNRPEAEAAAETPEVAEQASPSATGFPNDSESALLQHVPDNVQPSCDRWSYDSPPAGEEASVTCSAGAESVVYSQLDSTADMQAFFDQLRDAAGFSGTTTPADSGACRAKPAAYDYTIQNSDVGGQIVCYADAKAAWIDWSDARLNIVAFAWRTDFNQAALYEWWLNDSGPVE
ncbi:MAG: ferric reductase-like transmembrane domain-containing protein, partial [Actinomycetota bacterium]|nr:ferric reductase-like transmembrane domain-containing protein [Actinomycetota bacterium]